MKHLFLSIIATSFLLMSTISHAWVFLTDATIERIVMHEEDNGKDDTVIYLKDGTNSLTCYIKNSEKNLTSLALALYMAKKKVEIHCYEEHTKSIGSFTANKLHRLIAK